MNQPSFPGLPEPAIRRPSTRVRSRMAHGAERDTVARADGDRRATVSLTTDMRPDVARAACRDHHLRVVDLTARGATTTLTAKGRKDDALGLVLHLKQRGLLIGTPELDVKGAA